MGCKRVRGGAENGDIVLGGHGNDGGLKEVRRSVGAANKDVGLAAVAEVIEDVGGREEIALFVNEEGVAEETVVVAAGGGGLVELIDDRAHRGGGRGVVSRLFS